MSLTSGQLLIGPLVDSLANLLTPHVQAHANERHRLLTSSESLKLSVLVESGAISSSCLHVLLKVRLQSAAWLTHWLDDRSIENRQTLTNTESGNKGSEREKVKIWCFNHSWHRLHRHLRAAVAATVRAIRYRDRLWARLEVKSWKLLDKS